MRIDIKDIDLDNLEKFEDKLESINKKDLKQKIKKQENKSKKKDFSQITLKGSTMDKTDKSEENCEDVDDDWDEIDIEMMFLEQKDIDDLEEIKKA